MGPRVALIRLLNAALATSNDLIVNGVLSNDDILERQEPIIPLAEGISSGGGAIRRCVLFRPTGLLTMQSLDPVLLRGLLVQPFFI